MGSGGGGSERAQREAQAAEDARQRQIQASTDKVNAIFDAPQRQAQYGSFLAALRENFMRDAFRQKGVADRRQKFAIARSGLTGGSADVDANRRLGEEFNQGLLKGEGLAQEAAGNLRNQDEQSRLQLLNMIRAGLDSTTAASRAGSMMASNAQVAKGAGLADGVGNIFGQTAEVYRSQEEAAARRRGAADATAALYTRPFGR